MVHGSRLIDGLSLSSGLHATHTLRSNGGGLISHHPFPELDLLPLFISANLMGKRRHPIVVFIFISLTTSKIEDLFIFTDHQELLFCKLSIYTLCPFAPVGFFSV